MASAQTLCAPPSFQPIAQLPGKQERVWFDFGWFINPATLSGEPSCDGDDVIRNSVICFLTLELPWFFPLPSLIVPIPLDPVSPRLLWDGFAGSRKRVEQMSEPGDPGLVSSSTGAPCSRLLLSPCSSRPRHVARSFEATRWSRLLPLQPSRRHPMEERPGGGEVRRASPARSHTKNFPPALPPRGLPFTPHLPRQVSRGQPWCLGS